MKRMPRALFIVFTILILLFVVLPAWYYGGFVYHHFLISNSIEDSKRKGIYIDEQMHVEYYGNTSVSNASNVSVWREKSVVYKRLGLIPITVKDTSKEFCRICVLHNNVNELWVISDDTTGYPNRIAEVFSVYGDMSHGSKTFYVLKPKKDEPDKLISYFKVSW